MLGHLAQRNRYFALWAAYKKSVSHNSVAEEWDDYLRRELGIESGEEIAFAQAMAEFDKLLNVLLDGNRRSSKPCIRAHLVPSLPSRSRADGANPRRSGTARGGSWRHARPRSLVLERTGGRCIHATRADAYCFRRRAAWFNAAALMSGRRLRHSAIFPGQIRFNSTERLRSGVSVACDWQDISMLAAPPIRGQDAPAVRAPRLRRRCRTHTSSRLRSFEHGAVQFGKPGWKSAGVRPISMQLGNTTREAMLLFRRTGLGSRATSGDGRSILANAASG